MIVTRPHDPIAFLRSIDQDEVLAEERSLEDREELAWRLAWLEEQPAVAPGWVGGRMLARVLRLRLSGLSLSEVARAIGRERERARQMEGQAVARLRDRLPTV